MKRVCFYKGLHDYMNLKINTFLSKSVLCKLVLMCVCARCEKKKKSYLSNKQQINSEHFKGYIIIIVIMFILSWINQWGDVIIIIIRWFVWCVEGRTDARTFWQTNDFVTNDKHLAARRTQEELWVLTWESFNAIKIIGLLISGPGGKA